jgi:[acyl-carrier-protein] S-malonyltransferase
MQAKLRYKFDNTTKSKAKESTMTQHTAYIFPGQGSQELGMGKLFYDNFAAAKEVFQEVDDALSDKLSQIIFGEDAEALTLTENAQPAIMATSLAIFRTLTKEAGLVLRDRAAYVAGHSLGEYSALCAAGSLSLADTARLLRLRGRSMQQAAPKGYGTMAAILGLEIEAVEALLAALTTDGVCEIANDNAAGQVVISGERSAVEAAIAAAKEAGAKRAIELNVSAPFHSSIIQSAADAMEAALATTTIHAPIVPLVANVTAEATSHPDAIRHLLVEQVTGRVRWRESVLWMVERGVTHMVEIGHGNVLSGLGKRIYKDMQCSAINAPEAIEAMLKAA